MKFLTKERIILGLLLIASFITIGFLINKNNKSNTKYETATQNIKAYQSQLDEKTNQNVVFKTTIEQLEYFNDSITKKLLNTTKQLNIKNEQIKELSYLATDISKVDTVILTDTIFKDPTINIDTTIGDKWVNTRLQFKYPSQIVLTPNVKSEKKVILYSVKETVNPPKKWWICRLFQKKHRVLHATVQEENPHIKSETNSFIQIEEL